MIKAGRDYVHNKSGEHYKVKFLALDVTNECEFEVVVYTPFHGPNNIYVR